MKCNPISRLLGAAISAISLACGGDAMVAPQGVTAPTSPAVRTSVVGVDNVNVWETWAPIVYPSACTGNNYLAASLNIHLHTQTKTYSDGSTVVLQRYNIKAVRLEGVDGIFHLNRHGLFTQTSQPDGTHLATAVDRFKLSGDGLRESVELAITLLWDGVTLTVEFDATVGCK